MKSVIVEIGALSSEQIDYSVDLQRIIEDLCHDRPIREPKTGARHHYDMAVAHRLTAAAGADTGLRAALTSAPVAYITKAGLEKFRGGKEPESHVLLRSDGDLRVPLYDRDPIDLRWTTELSEIIGHLGSAIVQSTNSDDRIIMDHVRAAYEIAKVVRRQA